MKNVLAWVKTNWLIVTFCVVMVASLVAGYIGSNMWAKGQRTEFQAKVQQQMQQVQGARVSYAIPTLTPEEQAVSDSGPPNQAKTDWFAERIQARVAQAQELVQAAEAFNQGRNQPGSNRLEHGVLIPGLFPAPADERVGTNLRLDFRDRVIGTGGQPAAMQALLTRYGAGPSANLTRVQAVLTDMLDRENEAVRTETGLEPNEEQRKRIAAMLSERRVQEYQRASRDISMYATPASFQMARIEPGSTPTLVQCFAWQWDAWVASDILAALALANTDGDGLRAEVGNALVKRIERCVIEPIALEPPEMDANGGFMEAEVPPATITGRVPKNEDYDIRTVQLTLVASSERLPGLFDALARTNYMSVLEMNLEPVDPWADLRAGYYYGTEHVVRVKLKVETVWLRSWTGPIMPESVRNALGVVLPVAEGV